MNTAPKLSEAIETLRKYRNNGSVRIWDMDAALDVVLAALAPPSGEGVDAVVARACGVYDGAMIRLRGEESICNSDAMREVIEACSPKCARFDCPCEMQIADCRYKSTTSQSATPSSRWVANGEPDPHGTHYNCERAKLAGGDMTDDEVANEMYLHPSIVNLTIAKDRIRWLSRALTAALTTPGGTSTSDDELPGMWSPSDLTGGATDAAEQAKPVAVHELALKLNCKPSVVIKELAKLGVMATITQRIGPEEVELVVSAIADQAQAGELDVHLLAAQIGVRYAADESCRPGVAFYAFTENELDKFVAAFLRRPAGVVTVDYPMVHLALNAQPYIDKNDAMRIWQLFKDGVDSETAMRAALVAALGAK